MQFVEHLCDISTVLTVRARRISREQLLHCGLRKFRHSKSSVYCTGDIHNLVRSRFVYDTYKTMEATRSRHG